LHFVIEPVIKELFEYLKLKLGTARGFEEPEGEAHISVMIPQGKTVTASYAVKADYQKAPATIMLRLLQKNRQWKILAFHVDSDAFLGENTQ